jgi:hypothetical protein
MTKFSVAELTEVFGGVLPRIAKVFEAQGQPWMLLGGLAIGAWTEARATKDCDFALALPTDVKPLEAALRAEGFTAAKGSLAEVAAEGGVVRLSSAGRPSVVVDLLCAGTEFERTALSRRRPLTVLGVSLHVASPDDLVIYKLIAGRPQDLVDIEKLIRFKRAPEDEAYVRRWAREWGVEDRLDQVLRAAAT